KDYVKLLCDNERSRLRAAARQKTLDELYPILPEFIRDTILGEKVEGGHRPNHTFAENNMVVNEVEVLDTVINDPAIADSLTTANRAIVNLSILSVSAEAELTALKRKAEINEAKNALRIAEIAQTENVRRTEAESLQRLETEKVKRDQDARDQALKFQNAINKAMEDADTLLAEIRRQREMAATTAKVGMDQERHAIVIELRKQLAEIEIGVLKAHSEADVERLKAIQPGLIEAIEGLGDKQVLTQFAASLPTATGELGYLLGAGGNAGLLKMLEGSPLANTLTKIGHSLDVMEGEAGEVVDETTIK
ncbi:MAG: hypothetical protein WCO23_04725, partial [bacterium]